MCQSFDVRTHRHRDVLPDGTLGQDPVQHQAIGRELPVTNR
jgi:hypothetical protein